ncbi:PaaI family thioesterase [Alterisphingorhabdus coralli]|uniref:PaaI family thioesterase n=1 Tax=Alterisphingorhabdus coralli TaxID=3071408 RepID=A0AA97F6Z9_9SPHN|nr:PaaI family thioesterase [Parasphingorhabdus sp. SCSIO 66989]WOE74423.1 PaaI family thioesterase [Parasphingorhabdus sp. SCSIO 66989]
MANPADIVPFAKLTGIEIQTLEKDRVVGTLTVRSEICNIASGPAASIHGGALMTFADALGAFGAFQNLPEGCEASTTSESKTNFLSHAPIGSVLTGEAVPLKVGKRLSVWQTKITREDGELVAVVTQSQIYL